MHTSRRSRQPFARTTKPEVWRLSNANENFPRRAVEALRALGHDVLTTQEAGNAGQAIPDHEVLEFATRAGRAVLTLNRRDFMIVGRNTLPVEQVQVLQQTFVTSLRAAFIV